MGERSVRRRRNDVGHHRLLHEQGFERPSLGACAVAERFEKTSVEQIALTENAHELVIVVDHHDVPDAPEPHHVVRRDQTVVVIERHYLLGHQIVHAQLTHLALLISAPACSPRSRVSSELRLARGRYLLSRPCSISAKARHASTVVKMPTSLS